ncbi:MAG: alpha-L-rhamnosidase C-terminal domain-containing protein [Blautia sp.]
MQECEYSPGYKKFRIQPLLGQELDYASFTYESMYGKIVSGWERNGKQIKYKISVPANTTAEVCLSGKVVEKDSVCFTGGNP